MAKYNTYEIGVEELWVRQRERGDVDFELHENDLVSYFDLWDPNEGQFQCL